MGRGILIFILKGLHSDSWNIMTRDKFIDLYIYVAEPQKVMKKNINRNPLCEHTFAGTHKIQIKPAINDF